MANNDQNNSKITFKLNSDFKKWIDLANACGGESMVFNIRSAAKNYLTYYFPLDQNKKTELINRLKVAVGDTLTKYCLENGSVPIGLCLQEIIEVRGILNYCASWNRSMGNLNPNDMKINDFVNNSKALLIENIMGEDIQNTEIQNFFEYITNLNARILLKENSFYLKPEISGFISLLVKEKIDVRLIRFCQKCNKIIWIKRGTQIACSKKCINAINSANWRRDNEK